MHRSIRSLRSLFRQALALLQVGTTIHSSPPLCLNKGLTIRLKPFGYKQNKSVTDRNLITFRVWLHLRRDHNFLSSHLRCRTKNLIERCKHNACVLSKNGCSSSQSTKQQEQWRWSDNESRTLSLGLRNLPIRPLWQNVSIPRSISPQYPGLEVNSLHKHNSCLLPTAHRTMNYSGRIKSDNSRSTGFDRSSMLTEFSRILIIEASLDRLSTTPHMFRLKHRSAMLARPSNLSMRRPRFQLHIAMFQALLFRHAIANSTRCTLRLMGQQPNKGTPPHSNPTRICHRCRLKSLRSHRSRQTIAHIRMPVVLLWCHQFRLQMHQTQHPLHNAPNNRV